MRWRASTEWKYGSYRARRPQVRTALNPGKHRNRRHGRASAPPSERNLSTNVDSRGEVFSGGVGSSVPELLCAPSPRSYGERVGVGARSAYLASRGPRGESPSPGSQEQSDLSPQAGRG